MKRRMAIAVLGLTFAILTSASADARCVKRTISGTQTGTVSLNPATGAFSGTAVGTLTHLGRTVGTQSGTVAPTPDGHYAGTSTWTIVAANGDKLIGTGVLSVEGPPAGEHTTTLQATVTGGTGRFRGARGQLTAVYHVSPLSFDGVTVVNQLEGRLTGQIWY